MGNKTCVISAEAAPPTSRIWRRCRWLQQPIDPGNCINSQDIRGRSIRIRDMSFNAASFQFVPAMGVACNCVPLPDPSRRSSCSRCQRGYCSTLGCVWKPSISSRGGSVDSLSWSGGNSEQRRKDSTPWYVTPHFRWRNG